MYLIRAVLVILACLVAATAPARADPACPIATAATHQGPADHHHAPMHLCPAPMACCAPMEMARAAPAVVLGRLAQAEPRAIPAADRAHEDAARPRLFRPPTSI